MISDVHNTFGYPTPIGMHLAYTHNFKVAHISIFTHFTFAQDYEFFFDL